MGEVSCDLFIFLSSGVLLDLQPLSASQRGGLPANALHHHPASRRPAPSHSQHLHFTSLRATLFFEADTQTETPASHQDQEFWFCLEVQQKSLKKGKKRNMFTVV